MIAENVQFSSDPYLRAHCKKHQHIGSATPCRIFSRPGVSSTSIAQRIRSLHQKVQFPGARLRTIKLFLKLGLKRKQLRAFQTLMINSVLCFAHPGILRACCPLLEHVYCHCAEQYKPWFQSIIGTMLQVPPLHPNHVLFTYLPPASNIPGSTVKCLRFFDTLCSIIRTRAHLSQVCVACSTLRTSPRHAPVALILIAHPSRCDRIRIPAIIKCNVLTSLGREEVAVLKSQGLNRRRRVREDPGSYARSFFGSDDPSMCMLSFTVIRHSTVLPPSRRALQVPAAGPAHVCLPGQLACFHGRATAALKGCAVDRHVRGTGRQIPPTV